MDAKTSPGEAPAPRLRWVAILTRQRQRLLLATLLLLHVSILFDLDDPWARAMLIAHVGLFLLWQPVWSGESKLGLPALVFVAAACLGIFLYLNWWLIAFWFALLSSLVGARSILAATRWSRLFGMGVLVYLLIVLLIWVVPRLFVAEEITGLAVALMQYALPAALVIMFLVPAEEQAEAGAESVDFLYALLLFMVVVLVVLGSFAFMTLSKASYLEALIRTLFAMGTLLILLGLLWNPLYGFTVLQPVLFRYLLNVGTPFEQWLSRIADAAERESDAIGFLRVAVRSLVEFPWLDGAAWDSPDGRGRMGQRAAYTWTFRAGQLELEMSSRFSFGPSMVIHLQLLSEIVARFYEGKRREQALQRITRLKAIYETGARLTHDIKNLLQSLYALASASQQTGDAEGFQRLVQRQLPDLTRRLELTLGKLKDPEGQDGSADTMVSADQWWDGVKARYESRAIRMDARLGGGALVPHAVFDSVAENLLENALKKRQQEPGIEIAIEFDAASAMLRVCDGGSPIPVGVERQLFENPVDSDSGLGVGLYQAHREAARVGFELRLETNLPGKVCFTLAPRAQKG
ncbi:MAG: ATP-binding protein [Pseudomonadota bacterium]